MTTFKNSYLIQFASGLAVFSSVATRNRKSKSLTVFKTLEIFGIFPAISK